MKTYISTLELWILEHFFQRFSDLSFKYLRLTNFFWAVVMSLISLSAYTYLTVVCIIEKEYMIILAALPVLGGFVPAMAYSVNIARLHAYDHATWGVENPLKSKEVNTRRSALVMTFVVLSLWTLIGVRNGTYPIVTLIWWVSMINYPTFSFCACNPPGHRF
ncbi:MAG: hypothetical protein FGM57_00260 [Candidatus Taylorbacteria bacterium]|nr:hypothetical protein [Candidatus Taylorbacteria bacterium]